MPVGPVCTRSPAASSAVPESNSRSARSTSTAREFRALDAAGIDDGAGVVGRPIGAIGAGGEDRQRLAGAQQPRGVPARDAYCGRRGRACAGNSTVDSPPHTSPSAVGRAQRLDEVPRHSRGVAVEARGAGFELQAVRLRGRVHGAHTAHLDVRDDVALDRDRAVPASRPNNPEPITSGIVTGHVGDEQRERAPLTAAAARFRRP